MMRRVSYQPGETAAQWYARATGDYVAALAAVQIEWQRLAMVSRSLLAAGYPTLDDAYDSAMDSLEDADNERSEAITELDRESSMIFRSPPRVRWTDGGRFGIYHE
jgi:hypothetical protein